MRREDSPQTLHAYLRRPSAAPRAELDDLDVRVVGGLSSALVSGRFECTAQRRATIWLHVLIIGVRARALGLRGQRSAAAALTASPVARTSQVPLRPAVGMRSRARTARADRLCAAAVRVRSRVASQTTRALLRVSTNTLLAVKLASRLYVKRAVNRQPGYCPKDA